jgi:hypothetical protein
LEVILALTAGQGIAAPRCSANANRIKAISRGKEEQPCAGKD